MYLIQRLEQAPAVLVADADVLVQPSHARPRVLEVVELNIVMAYMVMAYIVMACIVMASGESLSNPPTPAHESCRKSWS